MLNLPNMISAARLFLVPLFVSYYLDGKDTETYTGYKNAPSATGDVVVYYNKDNKAVAVFVIADSEKVEASSDKLTYIAVKGGAKNVTDDGDNQY